MMETPAYVPFQQPLKRTLGWPICPSRPLHLSCSVEILTKDVKSCREIRSTPMDPCPSPFDPSLKTVPVSSVNENPAEEMRGFGLATLAPLATVNPSPPNGEAARCPKATATSNLHIELP